MQSTRDNAATEWFEGPLGTRVLREETTLARLALEDVFGFELLQVGNWGPTDHLLEGARTQHTTLLAPARGPGVTLCAPMASLPFASDSIDAILLPHTLERVEDPYAVLREAGRVLVAEGCLMIYGFNPLSGWGARRLFANYFRRPGFPPQTLRMLSESRLRDWMALLDFEVSMVYGYLGSLPVTRRPRKLADGSVRQPEYRARRPLTAGAYLLKARKRVQTLTLVRPKRRVRQLVLVPAAEGANKNGTNQVGDKRSPT